MARAVICSPATASFSLSTCGPSGTDGNDGMAVSIALPLTATRTNTQYSGQHQSADEATVHADACSESIDIGLAYDTHSRQACHVLRINRVLAMQLWLNLASFAQRRGQSRSLALLALLSLLVSMRAAPAAPSFDCRRAHSPIYVAICSSKRLSRLDMMLGNVFKARILRLSGDDKSIAVAAQRQWITVRDRNCGAMDGADMVNCIATMTSLRLTKQRKAISSDRVAPDDPVVPDDPVEPRMPTKVSPECRMYPDLC